MTFVSRWKQEAKRLKRETLAVYFACRDSRVPLPVKILTGLVAAYAFSPIDLIPDFVPVLGYLDDLILVPLGIAVVLKLIPSAVMDECREKAQQAETKPTNYLSASVIVLVWLAAAFWASWLIWRKAHGRKW